MPKRPVDPPLPKGWTQHVRSAFLHAVSLASTALTVAWSRAARGWNTEDTANRFQLNEQTLREWMRRLDEDGERALIQLHAPANRFPDLVRQLVKQLKMLAPTMGKVRIAQTLARAGLRLGPTTVRRILKERDPGPAGDEGAVPDHGHVVQAKRPSEVWHIDLTTIPTGCGFWVPWLPHSLTQRWPFCWWIAVVLDHFSRSVVGFALFKKQPTATEVRDVVRRAARRSGAPRSIVSDQGRQFTAKTFRRWCRQRRIRQRFGAVGQYGSIAVIERFFRSLKSEGTRRILLPLRRDRMCRELSLFATWYNQYRPHRALDGRTPDEARQPGTAARVGIQRQPDERLTLVVGYLERRRHLPIVRLRRVA